MHGRGRVIVIVVLLLLAIGAVVGANLRKGRKKGVEVAVHEVKREDLIARVSATGRVEAKRKVEISANVMGQIVNLAVTEGEAVKRNQFLLQIDQAQLEAQASGSEANLRALLAERDAAKATLERERDTFERAEKNYKENIVSEADYRRARTTVEAARASLEAVERRIEQARATLAASRDSLSKTTIRSPIDGLVTALPVEEGEIAVIGTMNNAGTRLMTISDMSEVQADLEVDETDIPRVKLGQKATITVDALRDETLTGTVSEIGSSPIVRTSQGTEAVEFSVKVLLDRPPPALRPGFSVSAQIDTGEAKGVLAIPVQALVLEDMAEKVKDKEEALESSSTEVRPEARGAASSRDDVEGVYRILDGKAKFVAVETGLQGELKIEVTSGLEEGQTIIVGPFRTLRALGDGDDVRPEEKDKLKKKKKHRDAA